MVNDLRRIHRFCVNHLVYPLVLSSLLACMLFAARVVFSERWTYRFLMWNLFLAWIPYLCSELVALLHQRFPRAWWLILVPSFLWLIFLPNAPYIITDWWHLDERAPVPTWYDIGMLAMFAWSGLFLGVASLNRMQKIIREYAGRIVSWLFVFSTIAACGLGIYLGRFLRWNSWDLFSQPWEIIADVTERFAHPRQNPGAIGFTVLFAMFFFVCYLTFISMEHRQEERIQ
ncbi:MAG: DUF1361 domain-containing protein [Chloroflexi bacterium]|nr:DUF1361 domain-containing protein [Chloroflexota bacterium]